MRYIFWTGGIKSTWRILQSILIDHMRVQPIYLNQCSNSLENLVDKQNRQHEISAIYNIIEIIQKQFPKWSHLLLPPIILTNVVLTDDVINESSNLFFNYPLYMGSKINLFSFLLQYSLINNYRVEVCFSSDNPISKLLSLNLSEFCNLGLIENICPNYPNLSYPLIKLSSKDIKDKFNENDWSSILDYTFNNFYTNKI